MIPPNTFFSIRQLRRWLALAALFALSLTNHRVLFGEARSVDASKLRNPINLLNEDWLVHAGNNSTFSNPEFNDSSWARFNAQTDDLDGILGHTKPDTLWYRLHLRIAPDERDVALQTTTLANVIEVYVNGLLVQRVGSFIPLRTYDNSGHLLIPIPNEILNGGALVIAMKVHIDRATWDYYHPGTSGSQITFGQIDQLREHMWYSIYGAEILRWLDSLLNMALMVGALILFSTQRNRAEYLWLFLWILVGLPQDVLHIVALRHPFPLAWHLLDEVSVAGVYFLARMYCAFAGHRIGWKLNAFLAFTCVDSAYITWLLQHGIPPASAALLLALYATLNLCILPSILFRDIRRGNRSTGLLLIPLILNGLFVAAVSVLNILTLVPSLRTSVWNAAARIYGLNVGSLTISYELVLDILALFSLALVILVRSNQISRRQAFLETELANAQEIQQIMQPESISKVPGYRLDCAYEPALQVGGDFFQIVPIGDEGMLIVTGDVTGKGLSAAMLVSMIIGAIRSIASSCHTPHEMLNQLNQQMAGRANGAFATAIATLFDRDGSIQIANAGHLPPYLDGKEVDLAGALPLGLNVDTRYESVQLRLGEGSRLTFYSDGIVEAQNKYGHLLGFDRARELSLQKAQAIVDAAKVFGQQDDMTVIIVERVITPEIQTIQQSMPVPLTA